MGKSFPLLGSVSDKTAAAMSNEDQWRGVPPQPSLVSLATLRTWFPLMSTGPEDASKKQLLPPPSSSKDKDRAAKGASPAAKCGSRKRVVEEARRLQVEKQKVRRAGIQQLWTTLDELVPGESETPTHCTPTPTAAPTAAPPEACWTVPPEACWTLTCLHLAFALHSKL